MILTELDKSICVEAATRVILSIADHDTAEQVAELVIEAVDQALREHRGVATFVVG